MKRGLFWLSLLGLAAWSAAPALWQVLTSIKPDAQITSRPTIYWPSPPTVVHYQSLFERKPFATYLTNSAVISFGATLLCLVLALPAAAALHKVPARRRDQALLGMLALTLFPPIILLFPLYEGVRLLGLMNNRLALVLPYAALNLPLAVWVLESALRKVPREIEEAAVLDGLGPLRRVVSIHMPVVLPSVVTAGVLVFIFSWNEFMLALTFATRDAVKTVTAGVASVSGASIYEIPWGPLCAAIVVATAPLILLMIVFERRITSGLTRGAVKG